MMSANEFPDQSSQAYRLTDALLSFQRRFHVELVRKLAKAGLSHPQYLLLTYLHESQPMNMGQIAEYMGHTTPATTGIVDRLSEGGYVLRRNKVTDRRQVFVEITAKGKSVLYQIREEIADQIGERLERCSQSDCEAWLRVNQALDCADESFRTNVQLARA